MTWFSPTLSTRPDLCRSQFLIFMFTRKTMLTSEHLSKHYGLLLTLLSRFWFWKWSLFLFFFLMFSSRPKQNFKEAGVKRGQRSGGGKCPRLCCLDAGGISLRPGKLFPVSFENRGAGAGWWAPDELSLGPNKTWITRSGVRNGSQLLRIWLPFMRAGEPPDLSRVWSPKCYEPGRDKLTSAVTGRGKYSHGKFWALPSALYSSRSTQRALALSTPMDFTNAVHSLNEFSFPSLSLCLFLKGAREKREKSSFHFCFL